MCKNTLTLHVVCRAYTCGVNAARSCITKVKPFFRHPLFPSFQSVKHQAKPSSLPAAAGVVCAAVVVSLLPTAFPSYTVYRSITPLSWPPAAGLPDLKSIVHTYPCSNSPDTVCNERHNFINLTKRLFTLCSLFLPLRRGGRRRYVVSVKSDAAATAA
jgi:hypothetical protein